VAEPVAVCDTAVPLRPHSNAVDRIATAEDATGLDDNLMTMSSQIQEGHAVPVRTRYHTYSTGQSIRYLPMTRRRLTAAVALSASGTKLPIRDVRCTVAIGGKADVSGKAHFGSDLPEADKRLTASSVFYKAINEQEVSGFGRGERV
jgi:hypothetical protein